MTKEVGILKELRSILPERYVIRLALPVALIVLMTALIGSAVSRPRKSSRAADEGKSYLAVQATADMTPVDDAVRRRAQAHAQAQFPSNAAEGGEGEATPSTTGIWQMFQDYALLGDSRAVGFSFYDFLDENRVFADGGHSIRNIPDSLDAIRSLKPSYIFLCYGLNDTGVGYWKTGKEYAAELKTRVKQLQEASPGATVVVNSILPATAEAVAQNDVWEAIPEFSAAAKEACAEIGVVFVDNDALAAKYMDTLWDVDGVHLKQDFYPLWAQNMIAAAMSGAAAATTKGAAQ